MKHNLIWAAVILAFVAVSVQATRGLQVAHREGQLRACRSNLKNIGTALEMCSTDASGRYPTVQGTSGGLALLVPNYLKSIPTCPAAGRDTYSASYSTTT